MNSNKNKLNNKKKIVFLIKCQIQPYKMVSFMVDGKKILYYGFYSHIIFIKFLLSKITKIYS